MCDEENDRWHPDVVRAFTTHNSIEFKQIPDVGKSTKNFIDMMRQNLQAEYTLFLAEAEKTVQKRFTQWMHASVVVFGGFKARLWLNEPDLAWYLISIKVNSARPHAASDHVFGIIAPAKKYDSATGYAYKLHTSENMLAGYLYEDVNDDGSISCQVYSHGYIGSDIQQHLAWKFMSPDTAILKSIVNPIVNSNGTYVQRPFDTTSSIPLNQSQMTAVDALERDVELIQGPPGTGKSTTTYHIIKSRIPDYEKVIVTCSRNGAVDSIVEKLQALEVPDTNYIQVVGNPDKIGPTANQYLLKNQVKRDPSIQPFHSEIERLDAAIAAFDKIDGELSQKSSWVEYLPSFFTGPVSWIFYTRLCQKRSRVQRELKYQECEVTAKIQDKTRVYLCTIASTDRLPEAYNAHTCIVDEAGCTSEMELGILFSKNPKNMVFIGDHKQLPPFTRGDCDREPKKHRSFFERAVNANHSSRLHFLAEQYRMPQKLSDVVSELFYQGRLSTSTSTAASRERTGMEPIMFLPVQGVEQKPQRGTSTYNDAECVAVGCVVRTFVGFFDTIPNDERKSICVLTMYSEQKRRLQEELSEFEDRVTITTVDGAQGMEFDIVLLSTVRTTENKFLLNAKRVNVAISRARQTLVVVGNERMLSKAKYFKTVLERARKIDMNNLLLGSRN